MVETGFHVQTISTVARAGLSIRFRCCAVPPGTPCFPPRTAGMHSAVLRRCRRDTWNLGSLQRPHRPASRCHSASFLTWAGTQVGLRPDAAGSPAGALPPAGSLRCRPARRRRRRCTARRSTHHSSGNRILDSWQLARRVHAYSIPRSTASSSPMIFRPACVSVTRLRGGDARDS